MNLRLSSKNSRITGNLHITGSKSETNRLLILQALFPQINIENSSNSEDTEVLRRALKSSENTIDISHAGTAMRFLTAYFSIQEGREILLTGSERMQQRPIKILVNALWQLGADISYENQEGFPPLRIKGRKLLKSTVSLQANVSSQYISALMLIAPSLPNGLEIRLENTLTSVPYLDMTRSLLEEIGVKCNFEKNRIQVFPVSTLPEKTIQVESDWSSASYFYSLVALSETAEITLGKYTKNSVQGDSAVAEIYKQFGVETYFSQETITLKKIGETQTTGLALDLSGTPDIAQTLVVTCLGIGISCKFTGLHTLKIKETDRLTALKTELEKFGAKVNITENSLEMFPAENLTSEVEIDTYDDHRMAMAFAPLALKTPLIINHAEVVAKSYPEFWEDMETLGFRVEKCCASFKKDNLTTMNEKELILKKGEQPAASISDKDLRFLIERDFPDQTELVKAKLNKIKSDTQQGKNRISASVLKLADRDLTKVDFLVRRANEDFRDIVAEAEYPRTSSYGFGERNEEESKQDYLKDWEEYSEWKEREK